MAEQEEYRTIKRKNKVTNILILINAVLFFITIFMQQQGGGNLYDLLALYYPGSGNFQVHQLITHMFMHGGFLHIFINMFVLWMFGSVLEGVWGSKRFIIFYFFTGLGAAGLHLAATSYRLNNLQEEVQQYAESPEYQEFMNFKEEYINDLPTRPQFQLPQEFDSLQQQWSDAQNTAQIEDRSVELVQDYYQFIETRPTVGASGAIYGLLLAFGVLFPNVMILLFFFIPMKAKYFVILIGLLQLYSGIFGENASVANFAHLGGMVFGFILLKIWGMNKNSYNIRGQQED